MQHQTIITKSIPSAHGTGEPGAHPPRTLRQIYSLCKSLSVRDTYAGKEIGSMILDDRSKYRYPKGCFGNRIIEATVDGRLYKCFCVHMFSIGNLTNIEL